MRWLGSRDGLLWLWLPLAVGVVVYFWPLGKDRSDAPAAGGRKERLANVRRDDGAAVMEEMRAEVKAAADEEEGEMRRLKGLSRAERRAAILALEKEWPPLWKSATAEDVRRAGHVMSMLELLAGELLADEGPAGLKWLDEVGASSTHFDALSDWVHQDPEAAFEYLTGRGEFYPCQPDAAMEALAGHAAGGGAEALMDGVRRMPWYLFTTDGCRFELPGWIDRKLWVESGAAEYLSEQGVQMGGVMAGYDDWKVEGQGVKHTPGLVEEAPELAIELWERRMLQNQEAGDRLLDEMTDALNSTPAAGQALGEALAAAGPETVERLKAGVERLAAVRSPDVLRLTEPAEIWKRVLSSAPDGHTDPAR